MLLWWYHDTRLMLTRQTVLNEPLPYTLEPNQLLSFLVATTQEISFKTRCHAEPLDMTKSFEKGVTPNKVSAVRRHFPIRAIDASEENDDDGLALTDGQYLYEVQRMVLDDSALVLGSVKKTPWWM